MNLNFRVSPMNEENMRKLESLGIIERLLPSKQQHALEIKPGEGRGESIYESNPEYGSHALFKCSIDYPGFINFAIHPDNEEFILLGGHGEKDLLLLIALDNHHTFMEKYNNNMLSEADFLCLKCVFNDPCLSFFVMKKNVPHGEATLGEGKPVTFYVTEGSKLPIIRIPLDHYKISFDLSMVKETTTKEKDRSRCL